MSVAQDQFSSALLDPASDVPNGLIDPHGRPAGRRFSVYRNNVAVSLTDALQKAFPVIHKLVGEQFFNAMAGVFLRAHPPTSPLLMFYGEEMASFLEMFDPVKNLPYLPDIARLEVAIRQSYHASDSTGMDPNALQAIPAEQLMALRFTFAPSLKIVPSDWPIHGIWTANMNGGAAPKMQPETAVITRLEFDPKVSVITTATGRLLSLLMKGRTLGDAMEIAGEAADLAGLLGLLLSQKAITGLTEGDDE